VASKLGRFTLWSTLVLVALVILALVLATR
jgi:hypothetical protein